MFVARYDYPAQGPQELSFREGKAVNMVLKQLQLTGEALKVINNEDDDWWLMYSLNNTENEGYVAMERNLSSM